MDHITSTLSNTPGSHTGTTLPTQQSVPVQHHAPQGNGTDTDAQSTFIQDQVTLSAAGKYLSRQQDQNKQSGQPTSPEAPHPEKNAETEQSNANSLSQADQQKVMELKKRDTEVRAHEAAHLATAGQYAAGGASYSYQQGPDGNRYAVGGEVPIDVGKERTPEETIQKMQVVRRAAMAPANPSGADRRIAAQATQNEAQARQELQNERLDSGTSSLTGMQTEGPTGKGSDTPGMANRNQSTTGMIDLAA